MKRRRIFLFPENQRAKRCSLGDQVQKLREEAQEVVDAFENGEGDARIIEEGWDVVQTVEGMFHKFPLCAVIVGFVRVLLKSAKRGDYAGGEDGR